MLTRIMSTITPWTRAPKGGNGSSSARRSWWRTARALGRCSHGQGERTRPQLRSLRWSRTGGSCCWGMSLRFRYMAELNAAGEPRYSPAIPVTLRGKVELKMYALLGEELPEDVERCKGDIWPLGDSTAFLDRLEGLLNLPVELLRWLDFSSYSHGIPEVGEQTLDST